MANGDILSDFGINLLEEEIDDVIFQTNEFLTDATFTGAQGPFWWLLVVSVFLPFFLLSTLCITITYKISFRETKPKRDKNGTEPQENKIKNALCPMPLAMNIFSYCKSTILSREKQTICDKNAVIQHIYPLGYFAADTSRPPYHRPVSEGKHLLKSVFPLLYIAATPPVSEYIGALYTPFATGHMFQRTPDQPDKAKCCLEK